jgi:diguanylate cyclase (GGDEF)-like protein
MGNLTLYRMYGLLLLSTGIAVALLYRTIQVQKNDRSAYWIAASCFLGGLGLLLLSTDSDALHWMGLLLFLAIPTLLHGAIGSVTRQSTKHTIPWMAGFTAVCFLGTVALARRMPGLPIHRAPAILSVPIMELVNVWFLLRQKNSPTRLANVAMSVFLLLHVAIFAARVNQILTDEVHHRWLTYAGMTIIVGMGTSFLCMEALRSRHDLEHVAMTDPLTGLLNRRALDVIAHRELQRCILLRKPCSALMMDIDLFKQINDRMGHAAGDSALRAVAEILQSTLSPTDVATRHGGDEFFVILPEYTADSAAWIAARLRQAIQARTLQAQGAISFGIQVSIGMATCYGDDMTVQMLLHESDMALYQQKQANRQMSAFSLADQPPEGGAHVHPSNA